MSSQATQTTVTGIFVALGAIAAFLAAIAQISGYSFRDVHSSRISSDTLAAETSRLISAIRSDLYGDNKLLTGTLSQSLALCDKLGLNEHGLWIRKELSGFDGYEQLEADLGSSEAAESWMNRWASHRVIETYFKVRLLDECGAYVLDEWPYERIFVAVPIQKVVEQVEGAKANRADELYVELVRLDRNRLSRLRNELASIAPGMDVPHNLHLLSRRSEYEKILSGIRDKISEMLTLASSMSKAM